MIDASIYTTVQIEFFYKNELHAYNRLDFSRCDDDFIYNAINNTKYSTHSYIPLKYRKSPKLIKDFYCLSKDAREKEKQKEFELLYNPTNTKDISRRKECMGLTKSVLEIDTGKVKWGEEEERGYESLVRTSIYQKGQELKINKHINGSGILRSGIDNFILRELHGGDISKGGTEYLRYSFFSSLCHSPEEGQLICESCNSLKRKLRALCRSRYENDSKEIHPNTKISYICNSSPSKAIERIEDIGSNLHSERKKNIYLEARIKKQTEDHGIALKSSMYGELFDKEAQVQADEIFKSKGKVLTKKQLLMKLLWNQSCEATLTGKLKGKKQVRFHPLMIRFGMMLRQKLNKGTYDFVAGTFNLPSSRTIAKYDSMDGSSPDGFLFEVARALKNRLKEQMNQAEKEGKKDLEWMRVGSLAFDSMSIKAKVKYDPHSHELVGFEHGALDEDVLLKEMGIVKQIPSSKADQETERPGLTKQMLIFMFTSWDAEHQPLKSVVARYATGSGIKADFLVPIIRDIISSLYMYGLIVVNVAGDGATENRSSFKQLATLCAKDVFKKVCLCLLSKN